MGASGNSTQTIRSETEPWRADRQDGLYNQANAYAQWALANQSNPNAPQNIPGIAGMNPLQRSAQQFMYGQLAGPGNGIAQAQMAADTAGRISQNSGAPMVNPMMLSGQYGGGVTMPGGGSFGGFNWGSPFNFGGFPQAPQYGGGGIPGGAPTSWHGGSFIPEGAAAPGTGYRGTQIPYVPPYGPEDPRVPTPPGPPSPGGGTSTPGTPQPPGPGGSGPIIGNGGMFGVRMAPNAQMATEAVGGFQPGTINPANGLPQVAPGVYGAPPPPEDAYYSIGANGQLVPTYEGQPTPNAQQYRDQYLQSINPPGTLQGSGLPPALASPTPVIEAPQQAVGGDWTLPVNPPQVNPPQSGPPGSQPPMGGMAGPSSWQNAPGFMQNWSDPYESQVVNSALSDIDRSRQLAQVGNASNATMSGAFGGDRHAILEAETNRAYADQSARTAAQLRSQGFDRAAGLAQQDATRALQGGMADQATGLQASLANQNAFFQNQGQQLQGAGLLSGFGGDIMNRTLGTGQALYGMGTAQQAQSQAELDDYIARQYEARDYPMSQLGMLQGMLSGFPVGMTQTMSQPRNRGAGFAGGAMSGAALGASLGLPAGGIGAIPGTLLGAGLGGLLGLF